MNRFILAILLTVASCGGGGDSSTPAPSSIPTVNVYDYRDFAPYRQSRVGVYGGASWVSQVVDAVTIDVTWQTQQGPAIEEHRIREYAGRQWVFVNAYRGGARNEIRATRVEISEGMGWVVLPPTIGNPYTPVTLTGPLTVRQWGWVYPQGSPCATDDNQCGTPDVVQYFWQHTLTPGLLITNICWHDPLTNTRMTIMQQEAWWDKSGWLNRSLPGEMQNGLPTGEGIKYTWNQTIAKDAGYLWTTSDGLCLNK